MLILRKAAEDDLASAYAWYEEQRSNLGRAFVAEIERQLQLIERHPERYAIVLDPVRRALCNKFPYSIYFIQDDSRIVVIAILHQRRSPSTWQARRRDLPGS